MTWPLTPAGLHGNPTSASVNSGMGVFVGLRVLVGLGVIVLVTVGVLVAVGVVVAVGARVKVADGVGVEVTVGIAVLVEVGVTLGCGVGVCEGSIATEVAVGAGPHAVTKKTARVNTIPLTWHTRPRLMLHLLPEFLDVANSAHRS